jgi:hypothetical protein
LFAPIFHFVFFLQRPFFIGSVEDEPSRIFLIF